MRSVFVDTSAFVALLHEAEAEHEQARAAIEHLISDRVPLFTSNFVFAETYTVLLTRVSRAVAVNWGRRFRLGSAIELVRVDEDVEEEAWEILESHEDKEWSYVDATSFALLEREGAAEAFAFDSHFAQRGLRVLPG